VVADQHGDAAVPGEQTHSVVQRRHRVPVREPVQDHVPERCRGQGAIVESFGKVEQSHGVRDQRTEARSRGGAVVGHPGKQLVQRPGQQGGGAGRERGA